MNYDSFKTVDIEKTLDIVGNDTIFLKEMLIEFFKDFPERIKKLHKAINNHNLEDITWYSHKIRGTLSIYYMIKASKIAAYIETNYDHSSTDLMLHFNLLKLEGKSIHHYFENFFHESFEFNLNI